MSRHYTRGGASEMLSQTHVHSGTISKVDRYSWQIKDCPGILAMMPKSALQIDPEYQREVNKTKVMNIVRRWSWIACGTIAVARRDGGALYVIDGQHRVAAAMLRVDIKELPCIIFETAEMREEARGFLDANTFRKPLTAFNRFKALLADKDEAALFVNDLIEESGRGLWDGKKNTVRCLTRLLSHAQNNREALTRLWGMIDEICGENPIHNRLLDALIHIEVRLPDGESLVKARWKNRLIAIGYDELISGINKASVFYENGGSRVYAQGVLATLNKGLQKKLALKGRGND